MAKKVTEEARMKDYILQLGRPDSQVLQMLVWLVHEDVHIPEYRRLYFLAILLKYFNELSAESQQIVALIANDTSPGQRETIGAIMLSLDPKAA